MPQQKKKIKKFVYIKKICYILLSYHFLFNIYINSDLCVVIPLRTTPFY